MKKIYPLILLLILQNFAIRAQFNANFGFINVASGTGSVDPGPFPQVPGLSIIPFKANGVSAQASASGRFSYSGWGTGAVNGVDDAAQFTGGFSGLQYYEVAITAQSGYTLQVTKLLFHMRRSSTGVRFFSVRSNADNFTSNLSANNGTSTGVAVYPQNEFFWLFDSSSTSSDQKVLSVEAANMIYTSSDTLVFRFFAWNAESSSGSFSIDNVTISGVCNSLTAGIANEHADNNRPEIMIDPARQLARIKNKIAVNWQLYTIGAERLFGGAAEYLDYSTLGAGYYLIIAESDGTVLSRKIVVR
jgi:hypothetical protein